MGISPSVVKKNELMEDEKTEKILDNPECTPETKLSRPSIVMRALFRRSKVNFKFRNYLAYSKHCSKDRRLLL